MPDKFQTSLNPPGLRCHRADNGRRAFTLTELLVVVGTLGILALVLLPALAGTQPSGAKAFQCLNNMRQMALAWTLYSADNQDQLVLNADPYRTPPGRGGILSWCQGIEDWTSSSINTNTLALTSDPSVLLAPYTGHRYQIFHCPSDVFVSSVQAALGWQYRIRSVSMSAALGDPGPFATSAVGGGRAPEFTWALKILKRKMSELVSPRPSNVYVFLDEAPDNINDAMFYNNPDATGALTGTPNGGKWIDFPSSLHVGGGGFGFADGHSEIHKWKNSATLATAQVKYTSGYTGSRNAPEDVGWMSTHTPLP